MSLEDLITTIEATGIRIQWTRFANINAGWDDTTRTIWLDDRLDGVNVKCILAHEYAHALLGHNSHQRKAFESRADVAAARLLISPADYALAERLHGPNVAALALELGVTRWAVNAYRRWLSLHL